MQDDLFNRECTRIFELLSFNFELGITKGNDSYLYFAGVVGDN